MYEVVIGDVVQQVEAIGMMQAVRLLIVSHDLCDANEGKVRMVANDIWMPFKIDSEQIRNVRWKAGTAGNDCTEMPTHWVTIRIAMTVWRFAHTRKKQLAVDAVV